MAIYHLSGQIMSRSQGRSAVAAAAYRAAEKIVDLRTELEHDYTKKTNDVFYKEILLPEGTPERLKDRAQLWNEVEQAEKRKDAQVAREFNMALPKELTQEQNIALAREFIQSEFVNQGMIADLCLHRGHKGGEDQPHIHVMLTLREVDEKGFGKKAREWNDRSQLEVWRESWEEHTNRHLALNGHDIRIDHRSNLERGINLEPQYKIGAKVAQREMARFEDHQRIARENGERILADPSIALNAITKQQSTFTHHDLAKFINRHTVDTEQFQQVYEKVKYSEQVVYLGKDEEGRERLTTKEMLILERDMLVKAEYLQHNGMTKQEVRLDIVQAESTGLSQEQYDVLSHITGYGDIKCVVGYAGSGKSTLLNLAQTEWTAKGYNVHGVTLSGIAAENLSGASGIESRTVASRLYYWDKGEQKLTNKDILVVDEAGMLGSRQMLRILEEAQESGAKVVLIGDPQQLQAIEAGAAFRAIAESVGYIELTTVYRQREEWQREATKDLAQGRVEAALDRYYDHANIHRFETQAYAKQELVTMWNDVRLSQPDKTQIMLAYTRQDVKDLNEMARDLRKQNNELGQDYAIQTARGARQFAENDRVYFLKNDRGLGVMNGTLGTIEKVEGNQITICLDKDLENPDRRSIAVDTNFYNHLEHGYAATIHKAQGVTVDRSYVLASRYLDQHAAYVGMSRHRESVDLFWAKDEFPTEKEMFKILSRDRSKDVTLDYGVYAEQGQSKDQSISIKDVKVDLERNQQQEGQEKQQEREKQERQDKQREQEIDPLQSFKAQYEAQHPERAHEIQEGLKPIYERQALEVEREINLLERAIENTHTPKTYERKLEKYACKIAKDKSVMNYFNVNNPALAEKIYGLVKQREHQRELALERSLGRDEGISY